MFQTLLLTAEASYPNGTWTELPPVACREGEEWGQVLDRAAGKLAPDAVLLLTGEMAARLGYGSAAPGNTPAQDVPALESARAGGWKAGCQSAWTTFWGPDRPAVHVGVLDWMSSDHVPVPGLSPVETAALIHCWQEEFGTPWHGTGSVAGIALLRAVGHGPWDRRKGRYQTPRWQMPLEQYQQAWSHAAAFRGIKWRAPGDAVRMKLPFWHTYDVNKQWLTAAGQTLLATDALTHTGRILYDPKRAGMWLVEVEPWQHMDVLPDPAGPRASSGRAWLTTPRLGLVHEMAQRSDQFAHMGYRILDSWTAPGYLVMKPWATALRALIGTDLEGAGKDTYARTLAAISKLQVSGEPRKVFRPDWACSVVDAAQCNLWRKLLRCGIESGRWPVSMGADQPTYGSDHEDWRQDVPAGLELGDGFGKIKFKSTARRGEIREAA